MDYTPVDLGPGLPEALQRRLVEFDGLKSYVQETLTQQNAKVGYGGYAEKRVLYQKSPHFGSERCIHLGLDLWVEAGTTIYCPFPGRVHSVAYNNKPLDYGATLIMQHTYPEGHFHSLYGHLSKASIQDKKPEDLHMAGYPLVEVGDPSENGGWVPHLHFQLVLDMKGWKGDFPGVATEEEAPFLLSNCPDPELLFAKKRT